ncbi:hypothetical protein PUN28_020172 [Cardiocondyla obscurior]|uniref:Uncharacterized protein n=1 Tax=Cardiocondyla obscurior TaxID=286306 RepID=A0AAW2EAZ3_9HYME
MRQYANGRSLHINFFFYTSIVRLTIMAIVNFFLSRYSARNYYDSHYEVNMLFPRRPFLRSLRAKTNIRAMDPFPDENFRGWSPSLTINPDDLYYVRERIAATTNSKYSHWLLSWRTSYTIERTSRLSVITLRRR